jgi:hypothetical protein
MRRPQQELPAAIVSTAFAIVAALLLVVHVVLGVSGCAHRTASAPAAARPSADETRPTTPCTRDFSSAATAPLQVIPTSDLPKLNLGERVGSYAAQDAAWVRGQPIAVNRDFDFALATTLDIGAGLAAARRQKENAELADKLASLDLIDSQALLRSLCAARADACARFYGHSLRLFGLLYGQRAARLRVVLELADAADGARTPLYVAVSDAHEITDFEQPNALRSAFETEIGHIIELVEPSSASDADDRCATGDSMYVTGKRIDRDASRIVLLASDPALMLVRCNVQQ